MERTRERETRNEGSGNERKGKGSVRTAKRRQRRVRKEGMREGKTMSVGGLVDGNGAGERRTVQAHRTLWKRQGLHIFPICMDAGLINEFAKHGSFMLRLVRGYFLQL